MPDRLRRALTVPLLPILVLLAGSAPVAASTYSPPPRVAIIVGPTGQLTSHYIRSADEVAAAAVANGASVAKAYSPRATPEAVLRAVQGANVVVYFGHGNGYPNPYSSTLDPSKVNGWGLQGPNAHGTHADSWSDGTLKYYGESWIAANAHPAPGWVMVYSQACYAAGSSEPHLKPSTWDQARKRAGYYSRTPLRMKPSAYFATNRGDADQLVARLLAAPTASYGSAFVAGRGYNPELQRKMAHPFVGSRKLWLSPQRRSDGKLDFGYAFAGKPSASPAGSWQHVADTSRPRIVRRSPGVGARGIDRDRNVRVTFDESLTNVSTRTARLIDAASGNVVPASVRFDRVGLRVIINPSARLARNHAYEIRLRSGIRNASGLGLAGTSWRFTTGRD